MGRGNEDGVSQSPDGIHGGPTGMDEELTKILWIRLKGRAGIGELTMGICYRQPDQED